MVKMHSNKKFNVSIPMINDQTQPGWLLKRDDLSKNLGELIES